MAVELARFQNFAKLKDTEIAFNDITVLAGKPGTGKSYVMKFMYAIDEAYLLLLNQINKEYEQLPNILLKLKSIDKLSDNVKSQELNSILDEFNQFSIKDEVDLELDEKFQRKLKNLLNSIFIKITQISNNFTLSTKFLTINYDKELTISVNNDKYSPQEAIFVETPLILEFKKFMNHEKGKTPYHIESLLNILDTDYSFTDEEQDKFIKDFTEKSKEIIKGNIESSGDSFMFNQEGGQNYDILNASSGTKSIGLLQYLVTNKALKKGSVLYWEEPEVHLHPEWQLRMVDLFVELMNAGIKIIFSTHSPYMADYLNAISQKNGYRDRVSFNLFQESDDIVENHILDSDKKWNMIQDELLGSLEDIMWEYL